MRVPYFSLLLLVLLLTSCSRLYSSFQPVTPEDSHHSEPTEAVIHYFLAEWVSDMRSLSANADHTRRNQHAAVFCVLDQTRWETAALAADLDKLGAYIVTVDVQSVFSIADTRAEVEWVEYSVTRGGTAKVMRQYRGEVHFVVEPIPTPRHYQPNPFGITITGFRLTS